MTSSIRQTRRRFTALRAMLIGGSRREQVLFAGVMKDLLAPINNPRYVIIGKEWGVRTYGVSFPCPSIFAPPPAGRRNTAPAVGPLPDALHHGIHPH